MPHSCDTGSINTWQDGAVAYIQLDRSNKANSYQSAMLDEINSLLGAYEDDDDTGAIVICGAGNRTFCSGADLDAMESADHRTALDLKSARVFNRLANIKKISVAAVNGFAVGGGLELALACDIRIASENARFFFPEPKLGLIPAAGGTRRLPRLIGIAGAKALILGGYEWDAEDAYRWGLVSEIVKPETLLVRAQHLGEQIARRDPLAQRLAKMALNGGYDTAPGGSFESVAEALLYELRLKEKNRPSPSVS